MQAVQSFPSFAYFSARLTTGTGATDLPRQLSPAATNYDVTFGLSLSVPATAYPTTYSTTLTFRVTTS